MSEDSVQRAPRAPQMVMERAQRTPENPASLRELVDALGARLWDELLASGRQLTDCRLELERARQRLSKFESDHERLCREYAALQDQVQDLGNHAVVVERLHGTIEHDEVLAGIQDCVINVIGSEELAIFEIGALTDELRIARAFGVEERNIRDARVGEGTIGRAALGEEWVIGEGAAPSDWDDLTACVPLRAATWIVGVLVIWRMLPHKGRFGPADRLVLDLLSRHGGTALYLTRRGAV